MAEQVFVFVAIVVLGTSKYKRQETNAEAVRLVAVREQRGGCGSWIRLR